MSQGCTLVEFMVRFGNQPTAESQSIDAKFYELRGIFQTNTARSHKGNLRKGTAKLAKIARPNRAGRKHFDKISSGFGGRPNFSRSQRSGHHRDPVVAHGTNDVQINIRSDNERGPRPESGFCEL